MALRPEVIFFNVAGCYAGLLERVGLGALCYVVLLLMPVLGRMSDQQDDVRMMSSRCFAMLVNLMPLEVTNVIWVVTHVQCHDHRHIVSYVNVDYSCINLYVFTYPIIALFYIIVWGRES